MNDHNSYDYTTCDMIFFFTRNRKILKVFASNFLIDEISSRDLAVNHAFNKHASPSDEAEAVHDILRHIIPNSPDARLLEESFKHLLMSESVARAI